MTTQYRVLVPTNQTLTSATDKLIFYLGHYPSPKSDKSPLRVPRGLEQLVLDSVCLKLEQKFDHFARRMKAFQLPWLGEINGKLWLSAGDH